MIRKHPQQSFDAALSLQCYLFFEFDIGRWTLSVGRLLPSDAPFF